MAELPGHHEGITARINGALRLTVESSRYSTQNKGIVFPSSSLLHGDLTLVEAILNPAWKRHSGTGKDEGGRPMECFLEGG